MHSTGQCAPRHSTRTRQIKLLVPAAPQAQALPVVMSGRDCIGVAKTGSGKTLAFVLPMLRHIKVSPIAAEVAASLTRCAAG